MIKRICLWAIFLTAFISCASPEVDNTSNSQDSSAAVVDSLPAIEEKTETVPEKNTKPTIATNIFKGKASFYNDSFHGKKTASGDLYDKNAFTAAVKQSAIPVKFGTIVEVHYVAKNKTVLVKVNDIMSESSPSIIDLSFAAAEEISLLKAGRAAVVITILPQDSATMARFEGQRLE